MNAALNNLAPMAATAAQMAGVPLPAGMQPKCNCIQPWLTAVGMGAVAALLAYLWYRDAHPTASEKFFTLPRPAARPRKSRR